MKELLLVMTMAILLLTCGSNEPKVQSPSLTALQKIYDNAGGKGDATSITMEDLQVIGIENLVSDNLPKYQNAIAEKMDFTNPAKITEVQETIYLINNKLTKSTGVITDYVDSSVVFCRCCMGSYLTIDDDPTKEYRIFYHVSENAKSFINDVISVHPYPFELINVILTWRHIENGECQSGGEKVYFIYVEDIIRN